MSSQPVRDAIAAQPARAESAPDGVERRSVEAAVELRAAPDGGNGPGMIVGYAATFHRASGDLGGFIEQIAPGAFRACMDDDVRCLRNHLDDQILGRSTAGTLRIGEDAEGLRFECDLADTTAGRDTAEMIRRGDLSGCSFQFRVAEGGDSWDLAGPVPVRTLTRVERLYDVGPVTFPAYESTSVACRSLDAARTATEAESSRLAAIHSQLLARQRVAEAELIPAPRRDEDPHR